MLSLGQTLKGQLGTYKLTKKLQESVWLAVYAVNQKSSENVIVKYAKHFRIKNERDVLKKFEGRTKYLRPLVDEAEVDEWPAIVLKYLEDDVLKTSSRRGLSRKEVKKVGKSVLEALKVVHEGGLVHTDIKPSNILVNYDPKDNAVTDVQLADMESTVGKDSQYAKDGDQIGTPIFRSPEAMLQMRWSEKTDIWSFGAVMISLLFGHDYHIFKPDVSVGHEEYDFKILKKHHQHFGPFPTSYEDIAGEERLEVLTYIMNDTKPEEMMPFQRFVDKELMEEDKRFLGRIMKLDPRDRPSAEELLEDGWFKHD